MIALTAAFSVLALAAQSPQAVGELRTLARDGPDSVLVERLRRGPRDLREALRQFLAEAAGRDDSVGVAALTAAEHLASGWLLAWGDSFFVRRVRRFRALSPADQLVNVTADSVVRAGNIALMSAGVDAAMPAWRESLRLYEGLADSAGMARALVAMAGGFRGAAERDSAEAYLTRCRDLAERIRDYSTLGYVMTQQAAEKQGRGDLGGAAELLAQAKLIPTGDPLVSASTHNISGIVATRRGDLAGARSAFEAALAAFRSGGNDGGAAGILNNLGTLAMEAGDYAEAAARYGEALSTYRELGRQPDAAGVLRNLGVLARRRGDYPAALTALSEAMGILRRTGPESKEIDVQILLSDTRADMGDLQRADTELDRAEALARHWSGGGAWVARLALARGHLAFRFNRLAEAEREYARAQRLARGAGSEDINTRNRAQLGMGDVLLRRANYRGAQVTLERVLLRGEFDVHNAAMTRALMGAAAWRAGDTATARRAFREAIDTLRSLGSADEEAKTLAELGDLEVHAGRALAAESLYRRGLTRLGARPAPEIARDLHSGLAGALRSQGALPEAARELLLAIADIERVSGNLPLEEHRAAFRADKWDIYIELALIERARGRTEAALEVSERLRARQMLELLARGRPATTGASGGTLVSREQDLRRKIAELTRQADSRGGADRRGLRDPAAVETANAAASEALARAQEEYGSLLLEIRETNPAYAALVRGEIASPSTIRAALAPDEALLEYLVGDSTTIVFVVTRDSLAALDLNVSHSTLAGLVDFARGTLGSPTEGAAQRAWRPSLLRLYRRLVAPVEASGLLAGKRRLVIAPHAELHYLPFAALVVPGPPEQLLIERYLIEYVPSASVWLRLRDRPAPPPGGGVLALAPRAAALPGSRAEVTAIQRTFGARARTLVGTPATERAFRALAPGQEIIHLATYGVLNKHNPMFSFVELGAGGDEDGRLEVHEVFGLTLNARLLVLSACQTGVGAGALTDVPPGDDWVGLVQGFLYAGASNVMATLWPVSDVATARLMERFYKELAAGRPEAEALALAQRAAARGAGTAHPFFWAGFTLVRGR